ncbi:AGC/NDR protein kinase [Auriculariales sp. MPI-PUGE-AT-0066]|nr:AGC/NDR protein kinase [Auriculariales sp. MPI-PUGE-AT-0066]
MIADRSRNIDVLSDPPITPDVSSEPAPSKSDSAAPAGSSVDLHASERQAQERGPDYVYFDRTHDREGMSARMKLKHFYKLSVQTTMERNQRRIDLENKLEVDAKMSEEKKQRQVAQLGRVESMFLRLRRTNIGLKDFRTVKVIGKGAFGEVRLVQKLDTGKIYAMKSIKKSETVERKQLAHARAERDALAESNSPWVVQLFYSFQDSVSLHLVMEFLPGGDLMTILIKYDNFSEDITRFYMAELVLAIEAVHNLGFIHRDIKPDNILIDKDGHIKLSDFGLSTGFHKQHDSGYYQQLLDAANGVISPTARAHQERNTTLVNAINLTISKAQTIATWKSNRRQMAYSRVGTPNYAAPEIFTRTGYGKECDWWSLAAIMFECLVGHPPFCSPTVHETYEKIVNWREYLAFPGEDDEVRLSHESENLIRRLITSSDIRLSGEQIKLHSFFQGVDWQHIREIDAPFIPHLRSVLDTSYFPTDDLTNIPERPAGADMAGPKDFAFIGYTFKRFQDASEAL